MYSLCVLIAIYVPFVYSVSLCCSVYCLCVNVYCTAATGWQPDCSLQIYHISYRIISHSLQESSIAGGLHKNIRGTENGKRKLRNAEPHICAVNNNPRTTIIPGQQ